MQRDLENKKYAIYTVQITQEFKIFCKGISELYFISMKKISFHSMGNWGTW